MRIWTEDEIRELLITNDIFLYRALKKLYDRQTDDEQEQGHTKHRNGQGFNGVDGKFMTSVAKFLIKNRYLTEKQKYCVRKKIMKYVGQLTMIANNP